MLQFGSRRVGWDLGSIDEPGGAPGEPIERRGHARHITILRVALLHTADVKELCVVRNISAGGLSARVYRSFSIGETVQVEFRSDERLEGPSNGCGSSRSGLPSRKRLRSRPC